MKLRAAQIILWLYLSMASASLIAASMLVLSKRQDMPMDHPEEQDVTDETTALYILEQLKEQP